MYVYICTYMTFTRPRQMRAHMKGLVEEVTIINVHMYIYGHMYVYICTYMTFTRPRQMRAHMKGLVELVILTHTLRDINGM